MAGRKICAAAGCEDLALDGLSHCEFHEARRSERLKERRAQAQRSPEALAGRQLYSDPRWQRRSRGYLRDNPLCVDCAELGVVEAATDVDHIVPHRGDPVLFWDRNNLQSLCHPCHSRKTAREVFHRSRKGGGI